MNPRNCWRLATALTLATAWLACLPCQSVRSAEPRKFEPLKIEYCWQSDPSLKLDWWDRNLLPNFGLNVQHFQSPRAEIRVQVAQLVIKYPNHPNFDRPTLARTIAEELKRGESRSGVRASYVAALAIMDDEGSHAELLWSVTEKDDLTRPTAERALAKWGKPMALPLWRSRLTKRQCTEEEFLLACEGIGRAGNQDDLPGLKAVATDGTQSPTVRAVAARAFGQLSQTDQLPLAKQLRASTALHGDWMAVLVLGKSTSPETEAFVLDIAQNESLLAQRDAYRWLCDHAPEMAQSHAEEFAKSKDSEVRRLAIVQINKNETETAVPALIAAMTDDHPEVRELARHQLLIRGQRSEEHARRIEASIGPGLEHESWKTREQMIFMAVELQQPMHVARLLTMLDDNRPEVGIAAAWALRHMASEERPLQEMLKHTQHWTAELKKQNENYMVDEFHLRRMAHLFDAFGVRKFDPARDLLLQYVTKAPEMGLITRICGIWSCGKLWEHQKNPALTTKLIARIADKNNMYPEFESVRFASTLALGWIADPATRASLAEHDEPIPSPIGYATEWALKRIDKP